MLAQWVVNAWAAIPEAMAGASFCKCCTSQALDGTEECLPVISNIRIPPPLKTVFKLVGRLKREANARLEHVIGMRLIVRTSFGVICSPKEAHDVRLAS